MNANFDQARVEVDRHLFLRLKRAQGASIVCLEGCIWITQDGCATDIQLDAGQRHHVTGNAALIVTGFEPSLVRVLQRAPTLTPTPMIKLSHAARLLAAVLRRWNRRLAVPSPSL